MSASKIARRDLLSVAVLLLGIPPARVSGFVRQRANTPPRPAPKPASARWTAEAAGRLRNRQELAYAQLGKRMGISGDPMAVYRELTKGRMPAEWISPEKFWTTFGSTLKREDGRGIPEAQIADYLAKYGNVQPPTPYEDPNLYAVLLEMLDSIETEWKALGYKTPARLLLGTLPTGTTNALAIPVPQTNEHIIVFERGLFDFAFQMSKLAAIVFPPIDPSQGWFSRPVNVDLALKAQPDLLEEFNRILHAYLVLGDPRRIASYAIDGSRVMTASVLLRSLQLFVLGHEYGHVATAPGDNLGPNPSQDPEIRRSWDREYGADRVGLSVMYSVMGNVPLTFWGPIHFFSCLEAFDRCRSILTRGAFDAKATSRTHPQNLLRAQQLRSVVRELRPGDETERAIQLANQIDSLWSRLWQLSEERWLRMYKQGQRPSVIWT